MFHEMVLNPSLEIMYYKNTQYIQNTESFLVAWWYKCKTFQNFNDKKFFHVKKLLCSNEIFRNDTLQKTFLHFASQLVP